MWYKLKRIMMRPNGVEKQVRPKWWWKPWANTICYYTFDNQNLDDSSGNNNNWSWYNGTGSFMANTWWYCANLWSSHAIQMPFNLWWLTNWTLNVWIKYNSFSKSFQWILWCKEWSSWAMHINVTNNKLIEIAMVWHSAISYQTSMATDIWYNICITKSWTTYFIYINGTLWNSWTWWAISTNYTQYLWTSYTDNRYLDWYLDNVIIENKSRTAQEISDYYNLTKSNYWL